MIIVIILWKILPGDENRQAFFDYWARSLELGDTSHLVGEYLSSPLSVAEAGFDCSLLGLNPGDDYVPFFNVGIWASLEAFREQVIKPFVNSGVNQQDFEYAPRERMVLSPELWRRGGAQLPCRDQLLPA
jgi:hypothetical protein